MYGVNLQNDKTVLNATKCDLALHHSNKKKNRKVEKVAFVKTNNFFLMQI